MESLWDDKQDEAAFSQAVESIEDVDEEDEFVSSEWVSIIDAADAISTQKSTTYLGAKEELIALISDGRLEMRAMRVVEEADIGELSWKYTLPRPCHPGQAAMGFHLPNKSSRELMELSPNFWRKCD